MAVPPPPSSPAPPDPAAPQSPTPAPEPRKPMPMAWAGAAIAVFIVIHTVVNIGFRKPGPAHEPAAEAREKRRSFVQASMKDWTRYAVHVTAPVKSSSTSFTGPRIEAVREPAPDDLVAALPFELVGLFTRDPRLHAAPALVHASSEIPAEGAMRLRLQFPSHAMPQDFGEILAYAKDHQLYVFLQDESRTVPGETPTPFAHAIELELPAAVLPAGTWQGAVYTREAIFRWSFAVGSAPESE